MSEHSITVIGAGSWGTALAISLARQALPVWLWGHNPDHQQQLQQSRCNARFLPDYPFPASLHVATDLSACLQHSRDILIAVPSHAFRRTLHELAPQLQATTRVCWATKGLEDHTGLLLHQVAEQELGAERALAVLSGPSFAKEVAADMPTAVTIASNSVAYAQELVQLYHAPHFRPYFSDDLIGVQLGGAIKNVIAISVGIADGLGLGANSRAALITRGLAEIVRFGMALGGKLETFMGLAGLGDLTLTCTDNQSRNRRFGYALAQGVTAEQALKQIGQVVEGVRAAHEVNRLAQQRHIDMPIVQHVQWVLSGELRPQQAVNSLLSRRPKAERA